MAKYFSARRVVYEPIVDGLAADPDPSLIKGLALGSVAA